MKNNYVLFQGVCYGVYRDVKPISMRSVLLTDIPSELPCEVGWSKAFLFWRPDGSYPLNACRKMIC